MSRPEDDKPITVALLGNPNTGKSTLFNALCGVRQRVGNFPGVTVEKHTGFVEIAGRTFEVDRPARHVQSWHPVRRTKWSAVDLLLLAAAARQSRRMSSCASRMPAISSGTCTWSARCSNWAARSWSL
jgi:hypothetical protein